MATVATIQWSDIIGSKSLQDGGYVGDLLELTLTHLERVRDSGQITDQILGTVYASAIGNALQEGIAFASSKAQKEAEASGASVQKDILDVELTTKTNQRDITAVDKAITEDPDYKLNKLAVIQSEADIAATNNLIAVQQKLKATEEANMVKEENGGVTYVYAYYWYYYDYNNNRIEVTPIADGAGWWKSPGTQTVGPLQFQVYIDGYGKEVITTELNSYSVEYIKQYFTYYSEITNTYVHTPIAWLGNSYLKGDVYLLKDNLGKYIVYSKLTGQVYKDTGLSAAFDLLSKNAAGTAPRTETEWGQLLNDWNTTPTLVKFTNAGLSIFEYTALDAKSTNPNNVLVTVNTLLGDGVNLNIDGSNTTDTAKTFTYDVKEDLGKVFASKLGTDTDPSSSITELKKREMEAKIGLVSEQTIGFKADRKHALEKSFLDSWGISFASLPTKDNLPANLAAKNYSGAGGQSIENVLNNMYLDMGKVVL